MPNFDRLSRLAGRATAAQFGEPVEITLKGDATPLRVTGIFTLHHEVITEGEAAQVTTTKPVVEFANEDMPRSLKEGDRVLIRDKTYKPVDRLKATSTSVKYHLHRVA